MKYLKLISRTSLFFIILTFSHFGGLAQDKPVETKTNENVIPSENVLKSDNDSNESDIISQNDQILTQATLRSSEERFRIGFQDTIEIKVAKHDELSVIANVNTDGTITVPRLDQPIVAVCKTERELQNLITAMYKNSLLRNPYVNVRVVEQRSQPFGVMGAVNKPGSFFLNQKVRLIQLLALAGGQDVEQAASKIQVARTGNRLGCVEKGKTENDLDGMQFLSYDLRDVLTGKENPWMQPGDIVTVLKAEQAFVIGDIYEPAKISLENPITLSQAIAQAGGLGKNAQSSKVVIQRQKPGSAEREELVYDLGEIRDKNAPDPLLQANDIVTVPTSKVKSFKNGLIKAIAGGIGNLFYSVPF